jgi:hypothetical protein
MRAGAAGRLGAALAEGPWALAGLGVALVSAGVLWCGIFVALEAAMQCFEQLPP